MKHNIFNLMLLSIDNENYRKVIHTNSLSQVVLMNLIEGEDIPVEIHENVTQFIYVVQGIARVIIENNNNTDGNLKCYLHPNEFIVIPTNKYHYIANADTNPLKLISIYSPPEHDAGKINYRE